MAKKPRFLALAVSRWSPDAAARVSFFTTPPLQGTMLLKHGHAAAVAHTPAPITTSCTRLSWTSDVAEARTREDSVRDVELQVETEQSQALSRVDRKKDALTSRLEMVLHLSKDGSESE